MVLQVTPELAAGADALILQQAVEAAVSLVEQIKLNCATATDALKIDIEVLRCLMEHTYPAFHVAISSCEHRYFTR